jgi:DNA helicase-4
MSLNNLIDFDDMIITATECVVKNGVKNSIKYIIIDEYQDTSYIRFCLINEIIKRTSCNLLVVGDDFQSIYKFSGCCLDLFLNFEDYFDDCKVLKLENTYRNSQGLIDLAGSFVMKNKKQIKKRLVSNKRMDGPIRIVYYNDVVNDFKNLIEQVYDEFKSPIMILGRNNGDINMVIDESFSFDGERIIYSYNVDIEMYYLTVHKAKGLEEDVVIVINLDDRYLGFPNKINEDKILGLVSNSNETYPFAEERRLFYVAVTRTRGCCYLFSSKRKPSVFVKEMEKIIKKKRLS